MNTPKTFAGWAEQEGLSPDGQYAHAWDAAIEAAAQVIEAKIKTYGPQMNHYGRRAHADDANTVRALKTGSQT